MKIQQHLKTRTHFTACLLAGVLSIAAQIASGQQPLLELRFNETSAAVVSTGAEEVAGKIFDAGGEAKDLHSQDRGGSSGKVGDRAFDESSTVSGEAGPVVMLPWPPNTPPMAKAFTITGWLKRDVANDEDRTLLRLVRGGGKRWHEFAFDLGYYGVGRLALSVNENVNENRVTSKAAGYGSIVGEWVFFAVVFDGPAGQVTFYRGNASSGVQVVSQHPISEGETLIDRGGNIMIGNSAKQGDRAFVGFLDNIRVYVPEGSSEGALGVEALERIMAADLAASPGKVPAAP